MIAIIRRFVDSFRFAWNGGEYKIKLVFDDPLIPSGVLWRVKRNNETIPVDDARRIGLECTANILRIRQLEPAQPGTPGAFTVKWCEAKS